MGLFWEWVLFIVYLLVSASLTGATLPTVG
jgi:archaellum component FlaG (FlaF/FlaG flagellin family)